MQSEICLAETGKRRVKAKTLALAWAAVDLDEVLQVKEDLIRLV